MEKNNRSIQDYLSLGYLYILALGILHDAIYYGFMGINILKYSNILDVLLSPIVYIADHLLILVALVIMVIFLLVFFFYQPKLHARYKEKEWYKKSFNVKKLDEQFEKMHNVNGIVLLTSIMVFSFFIGSALGSGGSMAEKLKNKEFKPDTTILFSDTEEREVRVIGQNTEFVFYVEEGETTVTAAPIKGNIKQMRPIEME
ncbi:MAG: hypothetical protein AAFO07_01320 [Bacteroidota bacterium]